MSAGPAVARDTRAYVISWFAEATYPQDDACPGGANPDITSQYLKNLSDLGYTRRQIEEIAKKAEGGDGINNELRDLMTARARIDGKPANPYIHPEAVADPKLKSMSGRYAYGFNLHGDAKPAPGSFEDPDTHEQGIDHALMRAVGCVHDFQGSLAGRPTYWAWAWGQLKDSEPAWLLTLSADDLKKDGPVTLTFDRALEHLRSNIDGSPRADATYRIDPDPRSHNEFHGHIKGGVITLDAPTELHMLQNPLTVPVFRLTRVQMRLKLGSDGTIAGMFGGYQPWSDLYFAFAAGGPTMEVCIVGDIPGLYYLLKKNADGDPDPKTGENTSISTAYYIETTPAFVVSAESGAKQASR